MLQPPPDRESLDKGALVGEGKERYLKSLERRLNKLQGSDKRAITSKDIMQSLNEAHDDHMHQMAHPDSSPISGPAHHNTHASAPDRHNDPWHITSTPNNQQQETSSDDTSDILRTEFFVDLEVEKTGCGFSRCLPCLKKRTGRKRSRVRSIESSLTADEEREYLMDCDELGMAWEEDT